MRGGRGPFRLNLYFGRSAQAIYMCLWHQLSPNFTNNGNAGTKFGFFLTPYEEGKSSLNHYFNLTNRLGINLQSSGAKLNREMPAQFGMFAERGKWHLLEYLVEANSSGRSDGIARIWVDGRPVLNVTDVEYFFPEQDPAFSGVTWNPTYGGGLNPVPQELYQRIGRWYVSVR